MKKGELIALCLVAFGLVAPLWPAAALGVVLAALMHRPVLSIALGLLLDVVWGAPPGGLAAFVWAPMTVLALLCVLFSQWARSALLDRSLPERL